MLKAVTRSAREVDQRVSAVNAERETRGQGKISVGYYFDHYGTDKDINVMVTEEDFTMARKDLVPSVSLDELQHYERVRSMFEGATKKQDNAAQEAPSAPPQPGPNGTRNARSQALEAMKRAQRGSGPATNGTAASGAQHSGSNNTQQDDDDDDFVIRTDRLTLNSTNNTHHNIGSPTKSSPSKGKGKGKSREPVVDGEQQQQQDLPVNGNGNAGVDEDLYD